MDKTSLSKKITAIAFLLCLLGFGVAGVLLPDLPLSGPERRALAAAPQMTALAVTDGSYMKKLETYLLDHFPARDRFRQDKAGFETSILQKSDSNGYYRIKDGIYHLDYEQKENNVRRAAENFNQIAATYFPDANAYYTIIPDKNYFSAEANGYPAFDYGKLRTWLKEGMGDAAYIDSFPLLTISDYYNTDLHWRQECITPVADALLSAMARRGHASESDDNRTAKAAGTLGYQVLTATDSFLGGYAGASALSPKPEPLNYLTNDTIQNARLYDYEKKAYTSLYATEKLNGADPYDFFLWGPRALLTLENPSGSGKKNLIIFRDSFGSSLAPLLLNHYAKITLVDLRYVTAEHAMELLEGTTYQDVLFLYHTLLLNNGVSALF